MLKEKKNNWKYNSFHGPLFYAWIDGRYPSPTQPCHVNQSNEYYIALIQGCIEIML